MNNNILTLQKNCIGCGVCADVCPTKCITLEYDNEGFLYPVVNENCIGCNKCTKSCPIFTDSCEPTMEKVYAAYIKDSDKTLMASTSGGVFAALAMEFLRYGGVVFGCAYDSNLVANHIAIENMSELKLLQGSKYVQSNTVGIYPKVKEALDEDRYVLYSGTPCQIDALKSYLDKDYPKLLTVDIVCHGVPSPKLFENYLKYLEVEAKSKIKDFSFRNKEKKGWGHNFKYTTLINEKTKSGYFDPYYYAFLQGKNFRESCYNCKYANPNRVGDITVGDYFAVKDEHPEFYNKKGVSTVIINNEKGDFFWEQISSHIEKINSSYRQAMKTNPNLWAPSPRPDERDTFYNNFNEDILKYFGETLKPPFDFKRRVRKFIPDKLKQTIKTIIHKA